MEKGLSKKIASFFMLLCTLWSLAAQNVFIVPFGPWRQKMFHNTLWSLAAKNARNV